MGAVPTPMPFAEVYAALEQKVIDSVEAQLPAGNGSKLFEVTKVLTKTGHINLITGLVTSASWFDSLPADLQTMLREEALKAGDVASYGTRDALAQIEADLEAAGMTVNEIDVTPFKEATAGVYEKLGYGDAARRVAGDRQRPVSSSRRGIGCARARCRSFPRRGSARAEAPRSDRACDLRFCCSPPSPASSSSRRSCASSAIR